MLHAVLVEQLVHHVSAGGGVLDAHRLVLQVRTQTARVHLHGRLQRSKDAFQRNQSCENIEEFVRGLATSNNIVRLYDFRPSLSPTDIK